MNLLFIYGTLLQADNSYAKYLQGHSSIINKGRFKGKLYDLGEYPGAIEEPTADTFVYGTLIEITNTEETLRIIDDYEGFGDTQPQPNEFIRKKIDIDVSGEIIQSWVYLYNLPVDSLPLISSGRYES